MEIKAKSEVALIFEKYIKNIEEYNGFMEKLFREISKITLFFIENSEIKKDDLIKRMKENITVLINYISKLDEKNNNDIYRCLSCIFGAFLGDAEGGYCEFKGPNKNNYKNIFSGNPIFGDSPGQVTDDSEMAMSCAFALMDNPEFSEINSDYLYYYYGLWHLSRPRDEGNTTRKALKLFKPIDFDPNKNNNYELYFKQIVNNNYQSLANGFLMRTSPLIVWIYYRHNTQIVQTFQNDNNSKELFELFQLIRNIVIKDNICTHPNDTLSIAHSIFCIMALGAICELKPSQILKNVEILITNNEFFKQNECKNIVNMIFSELTYYHKNKENLKDDEACFNYFTKGEKNVKSHMGLYYHAFRLTLYYLYFFDEIKEEEKTTKYRTIMNQICNFGGDTDTNAAIVGTVIGPLIGYHNFGKDEFYTMVSLIPKKRYIYSPALMVIFVYFLKDNINNNKEFKANFLKMLLTMLYEKIDINNLKNIFTN